MLGRHIAQRQLAGDARAQIHVPKVDGTVASNAAAHLHQRQRPLHCHRGAQDTPARPGVAPRNRGATPDVGIRPASAVRATTTRRCRNRRIARHRPAVECAAQTRCPPVPSCAR
eukprot:ctg_824.g281